MTTLLQALKQLRDDACISRGHRVIQMPPEIRKEQSRMYRELKKYINEYRRPAQPPPVSVEPHD